MGLVLRVSASVKWNWENDRSWVCLCSLFIFCFTIMASAILWAAFFKETRSEMQVRTSQEASKYCEIRKGIQSFSFSREYGAVVVCKNGKIESFK